MNRKKYFFPLFLLNPRPWPILISLSLLITFSNIVLFIYNNFLLNLLASVIINAIIIYIWWKDVVLESLFIGNHNKFIINFTIFRIIIFIISEVLFFVRFFWTFFHSMSSPDIMIGINWPPKGINVVNYIDIPLLNSILLLRRRAFVTWSHNSLIISSIKETKLSLLITISLGFTFLIIQVMEYYTVRFRFSDRVYGRIFFIATGFHGIHVMIGSLFLLFIVLRINNLHFSKSHILGFEFSIWYWHFVDLVWLYLFLLVYWFRC